VKYLARIVYHRNIGDSPSGRVLNNNKKIMVLNQALETLTSCLSRGG
jgi:hypothetical protein